MINNIRKQTGPLAKDVVRPSNGLDAANVLDREGAKAVTEQMDDQSVFLNGITRTTDIVSLRQSIMDALGLFGIYGGYFLAPLTLDPRIARILTVIGLPQVWERQYRARLHLVDPLPRMSLGRANAFVWPDEIDGQDLSARENRYLRIAARFGLARGIGTACYGPHGRSGFLGVVWQGAKNPSAQARQWVHTVGQVSFRHYCTLVSRDDEIPALSKRKSEVLRWIAEGKSNPVIAEILQISRSSVDVYVRRLFDKLGVADRTTAALRAQSLGVLAAQGYGDFIRRSAATDPQPDLSGFVRRGASGKTDASD